jgi:hypothetical protein
MKKARSLLLESRHSFHWSLNPPPRFFLVFYGFLRRFLRVRFQAVGYWDISRQKKKGRVKNAGRARSVVFSSLLWGRRAVARRPHRPVFNKEEL